MDMDASVCHVFGISHMVGLMEVTVAQEQMFTSLQRRLSESIAGTYLGYSGDRLVRMAWEERGRASREELLG